MGAGERRGRRAKRHNNRRHNHHFGLGRRRAGPWFGRRRAGRRFGRRRIGTRTGGASMRIGGNHLQSTGSLCLLACFCLVSAGVPLTITSASRFDLTRLILGSVLLVAALICFAVGLLRCFKGAHEPSVPTTGLRQLQPQVANVITVPPTAADGQANQTPGSPHDGCPQGVQLRPSPALGYSAPYSQGYAGSPGFSMYGQPYVSMPHPLPTAPVLSPSGASPADSLNHPLPMPLANNPKPPEASSSSQKHPSPMPLTNTAQPSAPPSNSLDPPPPSYADAVYGDSSRYGVAGTTVEATSTAPQKCFTYSQPGNSSQS